MTISASSHAAASDARLGEPVRWRRAGLASLLVHGAAVVALLLAAFRFADRVREAEPEPVVARNGIFDVVRVDNTGRAPARDLSPGEPARVAFDAPPSVRAWTPPPAAREPESAPPAARARPARTSPATSRPAPGYPTAPAVSRTNYGDFQRRHGAPDTLASANSPTTVATGPRVATDWSGGDARDNASPVSPGASSSAASVSMDGYFGGLLQSLRERHEAPAGLSAALSAEVAFTLGADGAISGLRIARSSGDAAFDRSVLEAFARVRLPARPDGVTDTRRLTFRVRDA